MAKPNKKGDEHAALVEAAEAKWEHDQLVKAAEAKWASENSKENPDTSGAIETSARGYVEGMTLGASEPVISGANAIIGNLINAGYDADGIKDFLSKAVDSELIGKSYDNDVERRRELKKAHPYAQVGSEVVGAFASPANKVLGAIGKTAGKAVEAIPYADKALKAKYVGGLARTAKSGVEGAAMVTAAEGTKRGIEGATGFIQPQDEQPSMVEMAALGGKIGAGTHAAIGGIKGGVQVASYVANKVGKPLAKGILASLGGVKPEVVQAYIEKGAATRNAHSPEDAKAILDQAIANIQEATIGKRGKFIDDVLASVEKLKDKVNKGSEEAYAILDKNPDKTVKVPNMKRAITLEKKTFQPVKGAPPVGSAARAANAKLDKYREIFDKFPKEISLRQAKMILQQLGHDMTEVESQVGGYGSPSHNAITSIRHSLDAVVKKMVPEYAKQMEVVAADTEALIKMTRKFGTPDKIMGKIDRFETASGALDKQTLGDLESRTMGQSNLLDDTSRLSHQLENIHAAKPVMRIGDTQSFMQSIFNRSSIKNKETLQLISQMSDMDLVTILENSGTKDAFTKQFNAGSANVNTWTVLGMAAAGGLAGGAPGAIIGAMVKYYGPSTTKIVLDGISRMQGAPTLRKIDKLMQGIPLELQNTLKEQLIRAVQTEYGQSNPIAVPKQDYIQTIIDIDGAKNLNSVEKAKAINSLNRDGIVNSEYLTKVMIDGGQEINQNTQISFEDKNSSTQSNNSTVNIDDIVKSIKSY